MTYHTPSAPASASLEIKKSEFIAHAYPIDSREALMFHVEQLRAQYPDARHVCYGYIIGDPSNTTSAGFDDDGEPNGTAGRPILNVLQHKAIGNCAILVVRYFGGIKLGAGGLTRAYAQSAQAVVDVMALSPHVPKSVLKVATSFADEAYVRHLCNQYAGEILDNQYSDKVLLQVQLDSVKADEFAEKLGIYGAVCQE